MAGFVRNEGKNEEKKPSEMKDFVVILKDGTEKLIVASFFQFIFDTRCVEFRDGYKHWVATFCLDNIVGWYPVAPKIE